MEERKEWSHTSQFETSIVVLNIIINFFFWSTTIGWVKYEVRFDWVEPQKFYLFIFLKYEKHFHV